MTPQELKNSILQLAIQGKLVEQRPEEGTAEELYGQIQAEKQRLIKAGKVQVKLLKTKSEWFGVTYQEDRQQVATKFRQFLLDNVYPQKLW